jgi:hypothetical protein
VEPHAALEETSRTNTPRLPAPFFAVMVITLDPLFEIVAGDVLIDKLFPLPCCVTFTV